MICIDSKPNPIPGPKDTHNLCFWPDSLPSPTPAQPADSKAFPQEPQRTRPNWNPSDPPKPRAPGLPIRDDVTFGHSVSKKEPRLLALSGPGPVHAASLLRFPPRLSPHPPCFLPVSSDLDFLLPSCSFLLCKTNPIIRSSSSARFCCPYLACPGLS